MFAFLKSPAIILLIITVGTNFWQYYVTGANLKTKNKNLTTQLSDAKANNSVLLKSLKDQKAATKKAREINKSLDDKNVKIAKSLSDHKNQLLILQRKHADVKKYLTTRIPTPIFKLMLQWPGQDKNSSVKGTKTRPKVVKNSS